MKKKIWILFVSYTFLTTIIHGSMFEPITLPIEKPLEIKQSDLKINDTQWFQGHNKGPQKYHIDQMAQGATKKNLQSSQTGKEQSKSTTFKTVETIKPTILSAQQDLILAEIAQETAQINKKESTTHQTQDYAPQAAETFLYNQKSHNQSLRNLAEIKNKTTDDFTKKISNIFATFIRKTIFITLSTRMRLISQATLGQVFTVSIKHLLFACSNIPENLKNRPNTSINNFRKQIQYLAQQILNYNSTTVYKNPDAMIELMQYMHEFLKENNVIYFSPAMFTKLDQIITVTKNCSYIFKNQNMIFTNTNTPAQITAFFQQPIDNTNNLPNIPFSHDLMHAIYDTNGYADQIIKTWQSFQKDDLNQDPINQQFAAFLTFLLLFENTIVATALIIDETSALYKVTNPVPVVINIK